VGTWAHAAPLDGPAGDGSAGVTARRRGWIGERHLRREGMGGREGKGGFCPVHRHREASAAPNRVAVPDRPGLSVGRRRRRIEHGKLKPEVMPMRGAGRPARIGRFKLEHSLARPCGPLKKLFLVVFPLPVAPFWWAGLCGAKSTVEGRVGCPEFKPIFAQFEVSIWGWVVTPRSDGPPIESIIHFIGMISKAEAQISRIHQGHVCFRFFWI